MATSDVTVKAILTPKATLSFPHLDKPQAGQGEGDDKGADKYSITLVFPPGTDLAELIAEAKKAGQKKFGANGGNYVKTGGKGSTFRNDVVDEEGKRKYAEGSIYISAKSEDKPGMVYAWPTGGTGPDKDKPALVPADKVREVFYPGAIVRAQLKPFGYDRKGNKGVTWALNNVQKLGDGERLDNRQAATEAFDADLSAVPADLQGLA
jgi:hypothetical protein